jgi:hypothetical protein
LGAGIVPLQASLPLIATKNVGLKDELAVVDVVDVLVVDEVADVGLVVVEV